MSVNAKKDIQFTLSEGSSTVSRLNIWATGYNFENGERNDYNKCQKPLLRLVRD